MAKIEHAWELKYRTGATSDTKMEGKDHLDKIFQLKLSLPPKDPREIERYIGNKA